MFILKAEPKRKRILATFSGFFSVEEVTEFSRQEQKLVAARGWRSCEYDLLIDTSGCSLQSQEVVTAFKHLVEHSPLKSRRIAIVCGTSLSRIQARRILAHERAAVFESAREADQWLAVTDEDVETPDFRHAGLAQGA